MKPRNNSRAAHRLSAFIAAVLLCGLSLETGLAQPLDGVTLCATPRYGLAALAENLGGAPVKPAQASAPADNPDFRAPEALAGLEVGGATLDVSAWKFRKPIEIARGGAQQIELDLDVLAHADAGLTDLRIMRGSNQVPYIVQRASVSRALMPAVTIGNDAKNAKLSRWIIKLPHAALPLTHLTCVTRTPLFQREMSLFEELADERGDPYRHSLGSATWTQTPGRKAREFSLSLHGAVRSGTLLLETVNGDNPPINLEEFTVSYATMRVLFNAETSDRLFLYYGNSRVPPPSYDLSLVAGELLAADRATAALDAEEQLKKPSWVERQAQRKGGALFWGILAVVVIGLLVIVSRLLPKPAPPDS